MYMYMRDEEEQEATYAERLLSFCSVAHCALALAMVFVTSIVAMPRLPRAVLCASLGVAAKVVHEYSRSEWRRDARFIDTERLLTHYSARACRALFSAAAPLLLRDQQRASAMQRHWCTPLEEAAAAAAASGEEEGGGKSTAFGVVPTCLGVVAAVVALLMLKGGPSSPQASGRRRWVISCALTLAIVAHTFDSATVSAYISAWLRDVLDVKVFLRWAYALATGESVAGVDDVGSNAGSAVNDFVSRMILVWGDSANVFAERVCVPILVSFSRAAYCVFVLLHVRVLL